MDQLESPQADTVAYDEWKHAPAKHRNIAKAVAFNPDATIQQIASQCHSTPRTVKKVLAVKCMQDFIYERRAMMALEQAETKLAMSELRLNGLQEMNKRLPEMEDKDAIKTTELALKHHWDGLTGTKSTAEVSVTHEVFHSARLDALKQRAYEKGIIPIEAISVRTLPPDDELTEESMLPVALAETAQDVEFRSLVLEDDV